MPSKISEYDAAVGSNLDYGFKWRLREGESILSSTWTVVKGAVTVSADQIDGPITACFLEPSVVNSIVMVVNQITTDNDPPRVDSRIIVLSVKRR